MVQVASQVYDDIYDDLKEHLENNSLYSPVVRKQAPEELNVSPLVVIKQYDTYLKDTNLKYGENKNKFVLEVEIYSIDIVTRNTKVAKQLVINELICLIDEMLSEQYHFNLDSCKSIPNIDTNINRHRMQYSSVIDKNKIIYRR